VTADTPRGLAPYKPNIKPTNEKPPTTTAPEFNVALRQKVFESASTKNGPVYHCTTCGTDCTRERYHSVKTKNMDLCHLCYKEGRFPVTCFSSDFVKYNKNTSSEEDTWSDEETLLLLEAIELYDDDWNTIAEYVGGSRTREECIYHFLQMPIEEPYREENINASSMLHHKRTPFSQADNPVMSVLAFLASAVDPEVASTAAEAAIAYQESGKRLSLDDDAMEEVQQPNGNTTVGLNGIDDMDIDHEEPQKKNKKNRKPVTTIEKAAAVALGSAAAKAKSLAVIEEREIRRLIHSVVETEVKKLELKMGYFEQLEAVLENELDAIRQQRKDIFVHRLAVKKSEARLQQEIQRRGGVDKAVEEGWSPQELQQFVQESIYKEDYQLVDVMDDKYLVHPVTNENYETPSTNDVLCL
jgi:SWI/SNF related-matrix-associated actin-dependent regulator of chromatin subfamily C